jgi:hypothetical protein
VGSGTTSVGSDVGSVGLGELLVGLGVAFFTGGTHNLAPAHTYVPVRQFTLLSRVTETPYRTAIALMAVLRVTLYRHQPAGRRTTQVTAFVGFDTLAEIGVEVGCGVGVSVGCGVGVGSRVTVGVEVGALDLVVDLWNFTTVLVAVGRRVGRLVAVGSTSVGMGLGADSVGSSTPSAINAWSCAPSTAVAAKVSSTTTATPMPIKSERSPNPDRSRGP